MEIDNRTKLVEKVKAIGREIVDHAETAFFSGDPELKVAVKKRTAMEIVVGSDKSDRTAELVRLCAQNKGTVIVVPLLADVKPVIDIAKRMGLDIPEPITFWQFCLGRSVYTDFMAGETRRDPTYYTSQYSGFYFDELERSLNLMIPGGDDITTIKGITVESQLTDVVWYDKES